jgi:hypothetical protein
MYFTCTYTYTYIYNIIYNIYIYIHWSARTGIGDAGGRPDLVISKESLLI